MIQEVIDGIINAIRTSFDETFRIYTESIEQGLIKPCFSILSLNPSGEREIGNRYKRFFPFMITYFPSSKEPIAECNAVCEELLGLLPDIQTAIGLLHAVVLSGEIVDGNLQFSVQYNVSALLQTEQVDLLEEMAVNTTAKVE